MEFAKLFTFPTGQLLVEREWVAIGVSGAGISSLVTKTKYVSPTGAVVTATFKTAYPTARERDKDFEAFDEAQASQVFDVHQNHLRTGREHSFSTDVGDLIERPCTALRMVAGSLKRVQIVPGEELPGTEPGAQQETR